MAEPRPKFAVVREDPRTEATLVERTGATSVLLVASAGDTALSLARQFPDLSVTCFDFNPVQLGLVERKIAARWDPAAAHALNQNGEFEGLFRVLRHFLLEFVVTESDLESYFTGALGEGVETWFANPYWASAFDVSFADPFLNAMFGPAATQHADPGSYGPYFRAVFERGLRAPEGPANPFLQHVLLGEYLPGCEPPYLGDWPAPQIELVRGTLLDVPDLGRFDLISLSNCLDWSDDDTARAWGEAVCSSARSGCTLVLRQLNNERDVRGFFSPEFVFDDDLGAELLAADRSLFYNRIEVARRA